MTKITENESFIIEAVGEGVIVSPLHHIAGVDYFAALRPELPTEEIFRSLLTALSFYGAPYDFLFDFATDDAVVCSELVCKAYSETPDKKGLIFKSFNRDAPFFYYPNDFARQCCEEASAENKSFNLVLFYDAGKNAGSAFSGFCHTLQRHSLF
jgi:hypothetical protein